MAQFVIHKKGFFYTDEAFEIVEGARGSIVGIFSTLEAAKLEKEKEDILSLQSMSGENAVDFLLYSDQYHEIYQKLEDYYKSEFGLTISDKYYFDFPDDISEEQAKFFLDTMELSFHDIVEYPDEEMLDPDSFNMDEYEAAEF